MDAGSPVLIAGAGMTRFEKSAASLRELAGAAARDALADAGVGVGVYRIEAAYVGNAAAGLVTGQEMIRGQVVLRPLGIEGVPIFNVENACASAASALHLGWQAVAAEVGVPVGEGEDRCFFREPAQRRPQPARPVRRRAERRAGAGEPHRGRPADAADVLADLRRRRRGGADERGAARRAGRSGPRIRASVVRSGNVHDRSDPTSGLTALAAREAFGRAGLGPEDVDCAEVHDASAPAELMVYEQVGFAAPGEGPALLESGRTRLDGALPVNTSGGLLSKGHPIGATGIAQICESTWQLRGHAGPRQVDGARVALTQNGGGWLEGDSAAMAVHILTAD